MKRLKITALSLLLIALLIEALPYSAVLCFMNAEQEVLTQTFSYFDPVVFGYANFGPFLTAIGTCVLLLLWIVSLFRPLAYRTRSALLFLSLLTAVFSLTPLLYGTVYYPLTALVITLLLFVSSLLAALYRSEDTGENSEEQE